jgi:penicillin-binding protein 2
MRTRVYALILTVFLVILLAGLAFIQIYMHPEYKVMSEENRLRVVPLMAPRGTILDRNGNALVKDILSFDVSVIYSQVKDVDSLSGTLSSVLAVPKDKITEYIKSCRYRPYSPTVILTDIGTENAIQLEELAMDNPGLLIEVSARREYLYGGTASNLVGYLGLINRSEFERLKHYGYRVDDLVGRDGVERYYDDYLRGKHGGKQVEVDHRGREVKVLGFREPVPGKDLYLTIDLELQRYCDGLLEGKKGAIIVMDPRSGEVLAMASSPGYDPEIFIDRKKKSEIVAILKDEQYPLLNRAITGAYPPGSVFKLVVAVAGLETKTINPYTTFGCDGSLSLGRRIFHCWRKEGHGIQNLTEGIKNSCNVFFWRLGGLLGVDNIAEYGKAFGIGEQTGIDLPGENQGLLPTREWKKKYLKESWYKGETLNYSVGQGYVLCSPLQLARMVSVFANGGYLVRPYVAGKVEGVYLNSPQRARVDVSEESLEVVREGMKKVVNDAGGTGMKARLDEVVVAGKTGTAQTSRDMSHGWFGGFAPYEDAKLTVVIFDEYGGKGGYYAAGTAGKIFKKAYEMGLLE